MECECTSKEETNVLGAVSTEVHMQNKPFTSLENKLMVTKGDSGTGVGLNRHLGLTNTHYYM